jgi:hypothetical protein
MIARSVAAFLSRPYRLWLSMTSFDPSISKSFRSRDEMLEWVESTEEHNASLRRAHMQRYAREHILPRLEFDGSSWPRLRESTGASARPAAADGTDEPEGFSERNRFIFSLLLAGIPLFIGIGLHTAVSYSQRSSSYKLPADISAAIAPEFAATKAAEFLGTRSSDIHSLLARLEALEARVAATLNVSSSPGDLPLAALATHGPAAAASDADDSSLASVARSAERG